MSKEIANTTENSVFDPVDLSNKSNIVDLYSDAEEVDVDLTVEYWTPDIPGETKRLYFAGIEHRQQVNQETGETDDLQVVRFFEKTKDGIVSLCNASRRLVGVFFANKIPVGTPVSVEYLGKKKNKTNAFKSDAWRVKPLTLKVE